MERNVVVKSAVNATVSIVNPQYGLNKRWSRMGQSMQIPFATLEQCLWENGIRRMFDSGILYIENMQDKIDLGLEPADATEPVNIVVFEEKDMDYLLKEANLDDFKKKMISVPRMQVDNLIEYAIHNEFVDMGKIDFLKKLTGKDILAGITRKRDMREAEEKARAAEQEKARRDDGYRN